jgi:hypothetical protein
MDAIELEYTLWLFNIAMENHHFIARLTIYFYGPFSIAMLVYQRVAMPEVL